jgi:hypothetical protein
MQVPVETYAARDATRGYLGGSWEQTVMTLAELIDMVLLPRAESEGIANEESRLDAGAEQSCCVGGGGRGDAGGIVKAELVDLVLLPGAKVGDFTGGGGRGDAGAELSSYAGGGGRGEEGARERAEAAAQLGGSGSADTGGVSGRDGLRIGTEELEGDRLCVYLAQYQLLDQVCSGPWLGAILRA